MHHIGYKHILIVILDSYEFAKVDIILDDIDNEVFNDKVSSPSEWGDGYRVRELNLVALSLKVEKQSPNERLEYIFHNLEIISSSRFLDLLREYRKLRESYFFG